MLVFLAGCHPPELAETLDVGDHPLLGELPAEASLVLGARSEPLMSSRWLPLLEASGRLPLEELLLEMWLVTGLLDPTDVEELAAACTELGCAAIVSGELEDLDLGRAKQWIPRSHRPRIAGGALIARTSEGDPIEVRRDTEGAVAWLGHTGAVGALVVGGERFDPEQLAGRIPAGDLWVYAHGQDALAEQVRAWLSSRKGRREDLDRFEEAWEARPSLSRSIESVALSLQVEPLSVRLWMECSGEGAARAGVLALQAADLVRAEHPDPRIERALGEVEIARAGATVELSWEPSAGLIEEVLQ